MTKNKVVNFYTSMRKQMKNNLILLILITCSVGCTSLHEKKKASKWEGNFMFFQMADTQLGYGKLEQDIKNFNQAIAYANQHKASS